MKVDVWAVVVVVVGVAIYIAIPVAMAVVYLTRAYATLSRGIPTASGSTWLGLSSSVVRRGTAREGGGGPAVDGGEAG